MRSTLPLVLAIGLISGLARAEADGDALALRLRLLDDQLAAAAPPTNTWWTVWMVGFGAAAGAQAGFALGASSESVRATARVGALKASLGVAALLFPIALEPRRAAMGADAGDRLRASEDRLRWLAAQERVGTSVLAHVASLLVNVAGGLYLWFHDGLHWEAVLSVASGLLVSEVRIFTQPVSASAAADAWSFGVVPEGAPQSGSPAIPVPAGSF